jgi:hypothetical protein
LLAADINNSGTISAADILEGRQVLLGYKDRFSHNSWIAVNPDYVFQNPARAYEETKSAMIRNAYVGLENLHGVDFDIVKIGDVNFSALAFESRSSAGIRLMLDDEVLLAGQSREVPVYADQFKDVYGGQFTLNLKGIELEGIISGALNITSANYNVIGENLVLSFNEASGIFVPDGTILFTMVVNSDENTSLGDKLKISDRVLRSEIYIGSELEIHSIELGYRNAEGVYALYQNKPNPFVDKTIISFTLPSESDYIITIFDATGRTVMYASGSGVAGYNAVTVNSRDLIVNGVLYYRLESGEFSTTRKMIVIK